MAVFNSGWMTPQQSFSSYSGGQADEISVWMYHIADKPRTTPESLLWLSSIIPEDSANGECTSLRWEVEEGKFQGSAASLQGCSLLMGTCGMRTNNFNKTDPTWMNKYDVISWPRTSAPSRHMLDSQGTWEQDQIVILFHPRWTNKASWMCWEGHCNIHEQQCLVSYFSSRGQLTAWLISLIDKWDGSVAGRLSSAGHGIMLRVTEPGQTSSMGLWSQQRGDGSQERNLTLITLILHCDTVLNSGTAWSQALDVRGILHVAETGKCYRCNHIWLGFRADIYARKFSLSWWHKGYWEQLLVLNSSLESHLCPMPLNAWQNCMSTWNYI